MIKGLIVGYILGVVGLLAGAYYYFASGMAPVAVADPMMPFERKMANMALDAHIEKAARRGTSDTCRRAELNGRRRNLPEELRGMPRSSGSPF